MDNRIHRTVFLKVLSVVNISITFAKSTSFSFLLFKIKWRRNYWFFLKKSVITPRSSVLAKARRCRILPQSDTCCHQLCAPNRLYYCSQSENEIASESSFPEVDRLPT